MPLPVIIFRQPSFVLIQTDNTSSFFLPRERKFIIFQWQPYAFLLRLLPALQNCQGFIHYRLLAAGHA